MVESIFRIIACHLVGDYVLQSDFLAKTKGSNWYHLIVHCLLYILPFYICFGFDKRIIFLLVTHIIIDPLKARWNKLAYADDQFLHYVIALMLYV